MPDKFTPEGEEFQFPDEVEEKKEGGAVEAADQIEIEIEDDTPEEDRGRAPLPKPLVEELEKDELDQYDEKVKVKLKQMRKVWHDERREKEAAHRSEQEAVAFAQRLMEENKRIKEMLQSGEKEYVATAQKAAEMELAAAKAALKAAHGDFDTDKIVEAQQALQEANIRLAQARAFKLPALQEVEYPVKNTETESPTPRPDEKAVAWQERNTWFGQDEEMTAAALGLHQKLVRSGVQVGSDEYYTAVDKTMRKRFPEHFGEEEETKPQQKPKAKPVVAPVTRSTSPNKIRLKASQIQLAKKFGLTPEQYARELIKLEAQNG